MLLCLARSGSLPRGGALWAAHKAVALERKSGGFQTLAAGPPRRRSHLPRAVGRGLAGVEFDQMRGGSWRRPFNVAVWLLLEALAQRLAQIPDPLCQDLPGLLPNNQGWLVLKSYSTLQIRPRPCAAAISMARWNSVAWEGRTSSIRR